ncbi:hypothetical protein L1A22_13515 [Pseudomonas extremaustralis]|jgi:hypothetical protein|nr:hypothetical protein [Pseudomonas extremaustralis]UUJ43250.1 hypothetical protein L1A22_13515 [Pseudomonas extremaustralis]
MHDDNDHFYQSNRIDTLVTLTVSGLTLLAIALAGYYAPSLLAVALH